MDPVGALIGAVLVSIGITLMVSGVRNRHAFGPDGFITKAISTGGIVKLADLPPAYEMATVESITDRVGSVIDKLNPFDEAQTTEAINAISKTNPGLAAQIGQQLKSVQAESTYSDLTQLRQLLAVADAQRHQNDANSVRQHVKDVTGESI